MDNKLPGSVLDLLQFLYYESQHDEAESPSDPLLEKKEKLEKPDPKTMSDKFGELTKILTGLGLKKVSSRLKIACGCFRLSSSTKDEHDSDLAVLFDISKIGPLADKGYVVLDAGLTPNDWSMTIIAGDTWPDEIEANLEDPKPPKTDETFNSSSLANKLVESVIANVRLGKNGTKPSE